MKFCQKCDSRLLLGPDTISHLVCTNCGDVMNLINPDSPRRIDFPSISHQDIVVISEEEMKLQVHPTVRIDCPKCDGMRAAYWTTIIGDEEESVEVQVFKCTKCRYTWREKG